MADVPAWMNRLGSAKHDDHNCTTCSSVRALSDIKRSVTAVENAIDGFVEEACDMEGSLYYLADQITVIAKSPLAIGIRRRLLAAVETAMMTQPKEGR